MNPQLQESNAVVIARLQAESAERIAKFNAEAGESDEVKLVKSAEKITIAKMKFGAEAGESDAVKIARIKIEAEAGDSDAVKLARINAEVAKSAERERIAKMKIEAEAGESDAVKLAKSAERIAIAKMKIDAETNAAQGTSSWFVSVCCVCVSFHLASCVVFPVRSEIVTLCPVCLHFVFFVSPLPSSSSRKATQTRHCSCSLHSSLRFWMPRLRIRLLSRR